GDTNMAARASPEAGPVAAREREPGCHRRRPRQQRLRYAVKPDHGRHGMYPDFPHAAHHFDRGDGIRMAYRDEGAGDPLVMVHGNPTWSYYYRRLIAEFSDRYRCIVPDHVGMGDS